MTVHAYIDAIAGDRGEAMRAAFETVSEAMPRGFELGDFQGAPHWFVPLSRYATTHNGEPLAYATLMNQKHHGSLYLMGPYFDEGLDAELRARWAEAGLTIDMGRSCLRFRTRADLDLETLADVIAQPSVEQFIASYEHRSPP